MRRPDECTQCGLCVENCPVEMVGGRTLLSFLANTAPEAANPWLCNSCWRCQEVCPAAIDIHSLIMEARRGGAAPEGFYRAYQNVLVCGYALCLGPEVDELRRTSGLELFEPVPPERVRHLLEERNESVSCCHGG